MVQKSSLVTNGKQEGEYMGSIIIRPDMQSIDAEVYRRYFRHCRFKGGGSTTVNNTSTYTPTPYELEMQQQEANYSKAIAPNALELNNLAMNVLKNSLGTVQVDYNGMNKTAQNQIANATNGMNGLIGSNNAANLGDVAGRYLGLASGTAGKLNNVGNMYSNANSAVNGTIGNLAGQYQGLASNTAGQLGNVGNMYSNANAAANSTIGSTADQYQNMANKATGQLGNLSGMYSGASTTANHALNNVSAGYQTQADKYAGQLGNVGNTLSGAGGMANKALGNISSQYQGMANSSDERPQRPDEAVQRQRGEREQCHHECSGQVQFPLG